MEFRCPRCQAPLTLEQVPADVPVRCGACNALFMMPDVPDVGYHGGGPVIDVHAEPVNDAAAAAGHDAPEGGYSRGAETGHPHASYGPAGRYVVIEKHIPVRDTPDFGCCGCGCMLILFLLFMAGCTSLILV